MNARLVHAVLAAGVENPSLIARWRADPTLLTAYGVEPSAVDLDALWKFAGLTVKVRHNGLREELPSTFRLMSVAGIEIELFAAYASERAERNQRFATTTEDRTLDLLGFLDGWLDRDRPVHALLWDVIRHERALSRLGKTAPAVGSSPNLKAAAPPRTRTAPTASSVPRIQGMVVLHEVTSDPRVVAAALRASAPDLAAIPRAPGHLCYWRAEGSPQIAILQLDELGFFALSLVDGDRTAGAVYRGLGGKGRPPPTFLRLLGELETLGVIKLRRPG